jgi:hypothetical protein
MGPVRRRAHSTNPSMGVRRRPLAVLPAQAARPEAAVLPALRPAAWH